MMWTYEQISGRLFDPDGGFCAQGYSGGGTDLANIDAIIGKNNPAMQAAHFMGPIPQGEWTVGEPVNSVTHGRYALPLTPDVDTDTFGRDHFLIHGDSIPNPGFASDGCIIQPYDARVKVWESGDHRLQVVGKMESDGAD
jgi:hypothetical protein